MKTRHTVANGKGGAVTTATYTDDATERAFTAGETDYLAASVMKSLSRSFRNQFSISAIQGLGLGLITFGVWPLLRMQRQFRDYVTFEKQQLWHSAEWVRTRRGSDAAAALTEHARQARYRHRGWITAVVGVCVSAVVALVWISMPQDGGWPDL